MFKLKTVIILIITTLSITLFSQATQTKLPIKLDDSYIELTYAILELKTDNLVCIHKKSAQVSHIQSLGVSKLISYGTNETDRLFLQVFRDKYLLIIEQNGGVFERMHIPKKHLISYSTVN